MQAVLPRPDVAPRLQEGYVVLAADADEPDPDVHKLLFKLKNASMLPIVLVADAEGNFLAGGAGGIDAKRLNGILDEAEGSQG